MKPGFTFLDIGCGYGFFAIPAARIVGEKGAVYGLDVDEDAINRLKKRAGEEGLLNLNLRAGEAEETVLCKRCAISFSSALSFMTSNLLGKFYRMLRGC